MRGRSLKYRIGLNLAMALSAVMVLFISVVGWYQREALLDTAASHLTQLSEVVVSSMRYTMLQNRPADADTIIHDAAQGGAIRGIRIFSGDGRITHSTFAAEVGTTVDRKREACAGCHQGDRPPAQIPLSDRTWTFASPDGSRLLATMAVLRNKPSCSNAACHHHSPAVSVLGVVEVLYNLDDIDQRIRTNVLTIGAIALGFVLLAAISVGVFVNRLVYLPLRDLRQAAGRISSGDLEQQIPVRNDDEFGELAAAFNVMTAALKNSHSELREWGHTLELKVKERTDELRRAQAETARGEKLASVGLLAAGVAHELNNPLTGVLTFASLQRQKMADGSADAEDMDIIIRETRRCANIIRRLLDFARDKPPEKKFADLNQIIEDTVRIVERAANMSDIAITTQLDATLPQVWADPEQIKQVIMNLLVNAQHAIDEHGNIVVRSRLLAPPAGSATPSVEISVTDDGSGIPPDILGRIFDPFFTTKVGKGTGLGLSVSHGIIEAHGGTIVAESTVGKGTTFRVTLPVLRTEPAPVGAAT